jgi:hypothetical protein
MCHESLGVLPAAWGSVEDGSVSGGAPEVSEKYGASPLATHDRAVKTATALILLEVARESINFELRRQHGFTEGQAAGIIREAAALVPRPARSPRPPRRRGR